MISPRAPNTYRIVDEPSPGRFGHLVVRPIFPLLGMMLGGAWLGLPWFVFNAFAVGSPTRWRETTFAIVGFVVSLIAILVLLGLDHQEHLSPVSVRFALLALTLWKLFIAYLLQLTQGRSFEIYVHYGGPVRNGLILALAGLVLEPMLIEPLPVWARLVLR